MNGDRQREVQDPWRGFQTEGSSGFMEGGSEQREVKDSWRGSKQREVQDSWRGVPN